MGVIKHVDIQQCICPRVSCSSLQSALSCTLSHAPSMSRNVPKTYLFLFCVRWCGLFYVRQSRWTFPHTACVRELLSLTHGCNPRLGKKLPISIQNCVILAKLSLPCNFSDHSNRNLKSSCRQKIFFCAYSYVQKNRRPSLLWYWIIDLINQQSASSSIVCV